MNLVMFLVDVVRTIGVLSSPLVCRSDLAAENLALRQQLAVLKRGRPRQRLTVLDRMFRVAPSRRWRRWAEALIVVKPQDCGAVASGRIPAVLEAAVAERPAGTSPGGERGAGVDPQDGAGVPGLG